MNQLTGFTKGLLTGVGAIFLLTVAITTSANASSTGESANPSDIVDTATGAGRFDTLIAALQAAGLVETLRGEGPFTVFAPTDEAFARIPAYQLEALLEDESALTEVLTYHVAAGKLMLSELGRTGSVRTLQGESLDVDPRGGMRLDFARVTATDIEATNGVIHVIDAVVLPDTIRDMHPPIVRVPPGYDDGSNGNFFAQYCCDMK